MTVTGSCKWTRQAGQVGRRSRLYGKVAAGKKRDEAATGRVEVV